MNYLISTLFILLFTFCTPKNRKIGIQPLQKFNIEYTDTIKNAIENYYGFPVYILKEKNIPNSFFINRKSPRYRADSIIRYLRKTKADTLTNIIGYTSFDISTTKISNGKIKEPQWKYKDWGVFGLGFRPGASCVVSDFRIKNKSEKITIARLKKVSLHELGHNLGLSHCPNQKCFMRDAAESIKTIDEVELNLCDRCKSKI